MRSALYVGEVMHHRLRPARHRFVYRTFSLLVDLDELPELDRRLRLFAYNRAGLLSFHDRDHGAGDGTSPRAWAEAALRKAGLADAAARIELLCFPRVLGYVFNPLTLDEDKVYFWISMVLTWIQTILGIVFIGYATSWNPARRSSSPSRPDQVSAAGGCSGRAMTAREMNAADSR